MTLAQITRTAARVPMVVGLLALVAAVGIGCGSEDDDSGASAQGGEGIVIGAAIGKSGFLEFVDTPFLQGAEVAIEDINADGGVDGRKLRLITADHKSEQNLIGSAAQEVIDDGAQVVLTSHDFDYGSPAARVANDQGILAIGGAGAVQFGQQGVGPLTFNVYPGNPTEAAVMAEWAHENGYEAPFVLTDTSIEYSKQVCDLFKEKYAELAGEDAIVGEETFKNDDPSISSQVNQIEATPEADLVVVCSYAPGGPAAIKQIRGRGIETAILGSGGGLDGTYWLEAVPNLSNFYNNAVGSLHGDDPNQERNRIFDRIEEKTGGRPNLAAQTLDGYAAIQAIAKAIEDAGGSIEGEALKTELEKFTDEPLVTGPTTYTPECHIPLGMPMDMIEIQGGKAKYVETVTPSDVTSSIC